MGKYIAVCQEVRVPSPDIIVVWKGGHFGHPSSQRPGVTGSIDPAVTLLPPEAFRAVTTLYDRAPPFSGKLSMLHKKTSPSRVFRP